jgi:hypothetical protein
MDAREAERRSWDHARLAGAERAARDDDSLVTTNREAPDGRARARGG